MIDVMPPQGLIATGVVGGAQVLGPFPFVLAGNGFIGNADRPYGALVQYHDGVAVQGFTNAGADSNPIFAVGTNDGTVYFTVSNGGTVAAASTIQAGNLPTPYAEMGLNIVGTIPSQIMTWWDNGQNYGAGLVENNNQVGLLLVNKGSSAYNGLNASSYTVPLFAETNGAVYTQALMNTAIGTNAGWAARNTLDDGSGNMVLAGHLTTGGSDGASNYVSSDFFWFQAQTSTIPSGAQGIYFNGGVQFTSGGTFAGTVTADHYYKPAGPIHQGIYGTTSTNELAWTYGVAYPSGTALSDAGAIRQSTAGTMYLFGMDGATTSGIDLYASNTGMSMWGIVIQPGEMAS